MFSVQDIYTVVQNFPVGFFGMDELCFDHEEVNIGRSLIALK